LHKYLADIENEAFAARLEVDLSLLINGNRYTVVASPKIRTTSTEYTSDPDHNILDTLVDQDPDEEELVKAIKDDFLNAPKATTEVPMEVSESTRVGNFQEVSESFKDTFRQSFRKVSQFFWKSKY
jgi:hypothetical protein